MAANEVLLDTEVLDQMIAAMPGRARRAVRQLGEEAASRTKQRVHVRSGKLRDSFKAAIDPSDPAHLSALVGSDEPYATAQEFGTTRAAAHPALVPAMEEVRTRVPSVIGELFV